jgi:purine-nucleoside phosphorylase
MDYAPTANFQLLKKAYDVAQQKNIPVTVGGILSSDTFYADNADWWKLWAEFGILAVEMETAALYTLAAKFKAKALSILTVSDNIVTAQSESAETREKSFKQMAEIALELI